MEIFALGAAMGIFVVRRKSSATLFEGILIPTSELPAVMMSGILCFLGKRRVIGHGISLSMIVCCMSFCICA